MRKAALPAVWSQGVKLAREKSVSRVPNAKDLSLRVRAPGLAVPPTVTLFPDDDEWSCDCDAKTDPCAHVVAATIAFSQNEVGEGEASAGPQLDPARLVYRLVVKDRRLWLTRFIVHTDGREDPVHSLTTDIARGRVAIAPTHEDVLVDRILAASARVHIPVNRIRDIFVALSNGADVTLDGKPIVMSGEFVNPRAVVDDAANGGFMLRIERDPSVTAVLSMGVARVGEVLRPIGETQTTGEYLEKLPLVRHFSQKEQAELVTRVIPELEKTVVVEIRTKRLARSTKMERPRIHLDLSHADHALSILPTIVYGDPPIARVVGNELVMLGKVVPVRRVDDEKALLLKLRDALNLVPGRRVDYDGHDAAKMATKIRAFEGGDRDEGHLSLDASVVMDGDVFDVVFESDGKRAEASAVIRAWRDGLSLVPLTGGGWANLPAEWLAKHGHMVADLLAARSEEKKIPTAILPELGKLLAQLNQPPPLGLSKLVPLLEGFSEIPDAVLPKTLNADLRPYQVSGVNWLAFLRDAELGAVLADDMGLGKTVQTIAAMKGRTLVVCPRSVVYNWEAEIARFNPGLRTSIFHGTDRELEDDADVTLTTYAVLRLDLGLLKKVNWDVVVLDEAQAIKNPASQTAQAAFALKADFRVALSGTPVENRLDELWSVMHFANPGLLGGRSDFDDRYTAPIHAGDRAAATRLREKIRPFVLRRMKRDVLPELPPRTDAVLHVELDERERAVYDTVRAAAQKDVAERLSKGGSVLAALEALLRLRQAACHSSLVPGQSAESSSKIERLVEALLEASADGHKALVFSQWTSLLDLVEPHLEQAGIRFTRLDGSTTDRAGVVAKLNAADGPSVMLISLKAGGTGLNLVAADHVFLLDPWWNPAVEDQAADRAHRIGQDRPVMVYRLVAKDTVEERILALQEKKRAIADVALGGTDQAGGITRADLLALLS